MKLKLVAILVLYGSLTPDRLKVNILICGKPFYVIINKSNNI